MIKFEYPKEDTVNVTFDDEKTNSEKIVRQLSRGGQAVRGQPAYIK